MVKIKIDDKNQWIQICNCLKENFKHCDSFPDEVEECPKSFPAFIVYSFTDMPNDPKDLLEWEILTKEEF